MGIPQSKNMHMHNQHSINSPHLMFANCKIVIKQQQNYFKSQWPFTCRESYQNWLKKYKQTLKKLFNTQNINQIKEFVLDYILMPIDYEYRELGFCSTTGLAALTYQLIEETLLKDMEIKDFRNQPYLQNQIWIKLYSLVKTADYFHQHQQFIGDIRPENIFIFQDKREIKIALSISWLGEKSLRNKLLQGQKLFLTEVSLNELSIHQELSFKVGSANDHFAIGLTLAQCVLLQDLSKIYDYQEKQIRINKKLHHQVIQRLLRIKYYPLQLILLIIGMIQLEQIHRFTSAQVSKCLQTFKTEIIQQNSFVISKALLMKCFGLKYENLLHLLNDFKLENNKRAFINNQLSISNIYTINGISTVQMVKRTCDDTFNAQLLDLSNRTQKQYKISQAESTNNNKSWSNTDQKNHYVHKAKTSNILDQYYHSSLCSKGAPAQIEKETPTKIKKKQEILKLSPLLIESDVKLITTNKKYQKESIIPLTNHKNQCFSPQLQIYQQKNDEIEQNFSFHSPDSDIREVIDNHTQNQKFPHLKKLSLNIASLSQSIVIPNVYQTNCPPQSYVSYQYSKSISKKDQSPYQESPYSNAIQTSKKWPEKHKSYEDIMANID